MGTYVRFLGRQFFICPSELPKNISLSGRTGIITGSNIGLGLSAAHQLLSHQSPLSRLILAVRSEAKGSAARNELLAAHPNIKTKIEVWILDLDAYDSIKAFVEKCKVLERLDFVVLNAGVMKTVFETNKKTGNEATVQTNWLSTALLSMLLLPVLEREENTAPSPHLTLVGSETGEWAAFKEAKSQPIIEALNKKENFDPTDRYYTSKLMLMYFFREFVQRASSGNDQTGKGTKGKVIINIVNPGFCYGSGLHRDVPGIQGVILGGMKRVIGRSSGLGARTLVDAAVGKEEESHGRYLEDCKVKEFWPLFKAEESHTTQKQLWEEMAKELAGVADLSRYASRE